jgi:hypothetical protein
MAPSSAGTGLRRSRIIVAIKIINAIRYGFKICANSFLSNNKKATSLSGSSFII